jgi:anti-anti-sigma factor
MTGLGHSKDISFECPHALVFHQPADQSARKVQVWISVALARGEKVIYKRAAASTGGKLSWPRLAGQAMRDGQLEILSAEDVYARTGGEHRALFEFHAALAAQARKQGFHRTAVTGDDAATYIISPDREQLLAHERDLDRLAAELDMRLLCRYAIHAEQRSLLGSLAGIHHQCIDDLLWTCRTQERTLILSGEVDISNADRLASVLRAALDEGVRTIDLSRLAFLAAAGLQALEQSLDRLPSHGDQLVLMGVAPVIVRSLTTVGLSRRPELKIVPAHGRRVTS